MQSLRICLIGDGQSIHLKTWKEFFEGEGHDVLLYSTTERPGSFWKGLWGIRTLFRIFRLRTLLQRMQPDVIHIHSVSIMIISRLFSRTSVCIVSAWGHDVYQYWTRNFLRIFIGKHLLAMADIVTTSSDDMARILREQLAVNPHAMRTFTWGIHYHIFASAKPGSREHIRGQLSIELDRCVFLINRFFPAMDHQLVFEAMQILKTQPVDYEVLIIQGVTTDQWWNTVRNTAVSLDVHQRIRWVPNFLPLDEMAQYVQAADVYLNILRWDQRGLSLFEAMAGGLVLLTNNLPVYREFLSDGANAVIVQDAGAAPLAEKMKYVIRELSDLQQRFVAINQAYVRENERREYKEQLMLQLYYDTLDLHRNNFIQDQHL